MTTDTARTVPPLDGTPPARQRGVVLVVSLIMLLLLTIIGVTSMSTSNLQELMARNVLDRNTAFQAGESVLIDGETEVETLLTPGDFLSISAGSCTDGANGGLCVPVSTTGATPVWADTSITDWDVDTDTRTYGEFTSVSVAEIAAHLARLPRYIVELFEEPACVSEPGYEIGTFVKYDKYRLTSEANGRSDTTRVRLQTMYRKRNGTC